MGGRHFPAEMAVGIFGHTSAKSAPKLLLLRIEPSALPSVFRRRGANLSMGGLVSVPLRSNDPDECVPELGHRVESLASLHCRRSIRRKRPRFPSNGRLEACPIHVSCAVSLRCVARQQAG